MSKHTPGPWKFEDEYIRAECLTGDEGNMIADPYCLPTKDYGEEMEANARLIAASPELLAAAKIMIAYAEAYKGRFPDNVRKRDLKFARAAIAKAEGGE